MEGRSFDFRKEKVMKATSWKVATAVAAAITASVLVLAAAPGVGSAQGASPVVVTNKVTAKAKVVDIDRANRTVTLQQPNGEKTEVKVGDDVRNFDQIKKGDQVVVQYYESVGLDLRKGGGKGQPSASTGPDVVQVAPKGGKPAGVAASTSVITARVEAIDPQKRLVTLRGPKGNTVTVRAGDEVNLARIKKGDQVEATYTQALAVAVDKPKA
jgi:hypothetical protein